MKTFEEYNNKKYKAMEDLFIELSHLDDLIISFEFTDRKYSLIYSYKNDYLFNQNKKYMEFWINYTEIWEKFEDKFRIHYDDVKIFMEDMIEKYFNLTGYTAF